MKTKVVRNPKTGMLETVPDYGEVTPEQVAETRRKLRDMLSGNTPFHVDPNAEKKEESKKPLDEQTDYDYNGYFGFAGIIPT